MGQQGATLGQPSTFRLELPHTPLTDIAARSAKPTGKTIKLFDERGLYLEVSPSGGKCWRLEHRFGGKEKRLSSGVYPDITLKASGERRDIARKLLVEGIDPSDDRKRSEADQSARASNTFEIIAREWFAKFASAHVPKHHVRVVRLFERDIFPDLGSKPISEVSAPELLLGLRKIEEQGALDTAHRPLGYIGQVFRYAVSTRRCLRDPSTDLRGALPPVRGGHFAAATSLKRFAQVLRAIDGYDGMPAVRCALKLAPLVFVRPGELRTAEWKDIDLESAQSCYTVTKTKTPHIVPSAKQSVALLKELRPITGNGRLVFPGARSSQRPMSNTAILAAMRRMAIDKAEMSGHGFRATARTILDAVLGFRQEFIEQQLAHAVRDPNGRAYNRTSTCRSEQQ